MGEGQKDMKVEMKEREKSNKEVWAKKERE